MNSRLSNRSLERLEGVHDDLVRVVKRADEILTAENPIFDIGVIEGKRTLETQKEYVETGASTTLRSRHLPTLNGEYEYENGIGHAVDLLCYYKGEVSWHMGHYQLIHESAMDRAADELDINIVWGGDWDDDGDYEEHQFKDGPHWQLSWKEYPG